MARIRTVKPDIRRSLVVSSWAYPIRWTFVGLPGYVDDEGRGVDDVRLIKAELYPLDDDMTCRKIEQHLIAIASNGPLCRYEVDGQRYMHITSWAEHQRVNRPTPSRIPPCPIHEKGVTDHGVLSEESRSAHDALTEASSQEGKGRERSKEGSDAATAADPPRTDVEGLCRYFLAAIQRNGVKATITEKWRTEARLLLDRDKRDRNEIAAVIDWAAQDAFWKQNVHSVPTLRDKYDKLRLGMLATHPVATGNPATAWAREQG